MWPEAPPRQLILDLNRAPASESEDFLVSPANEDAFRLAGLWPDWPAPVLVLTGPPGSGKSHLAAIWARAARARAITLSGDLEPNALEPGAALLIEDCDRAHHPEAAMFHLLNLIGERGGSALLTARKKPDQWGVATPDLLSRLRLAPSVAMREPDPALIRAVLVKLFTDRQIRIEEDVISYAALHLDQSLEACARFVAAADEAALSAGRRITRPLAAAAIAAMREAGDE